MIYASAYVECVAKRYSWPPLFPFSEEKQAIDMGSALPARVRQHSETGALRFTISQLNLFDLLFTKEIPTIHKDKIT